MPANVLAIGPKAVLREAFLPYIQQLSWHVHSLETVQEARRAVQLDLFDAVLALESLADGQGYDLAATVSQQSGNLFVGVPLSEGHLWLPVVRSGRKVLGMRGVGPLDIGLEIARLMGVPRDFPISGRVQSAVLHKAALSTRSRIIRSDHR